MLTISTCAGGTTQGVDLGGIKQLGKREAELQREQSTASKPGQDTRIKMELEKKTSQIASTRTPQERHQHMPVRNTMTELVCIQKQEVFWGQTQTTVL